nr:MAG TPA: hypothetical protein [Caudoviricetes sp.]
MNFNFKRLGLWNIRIEKIGSSKYSKVLLFILRGNKGLNV